MVNYDTNKVYNFAILGTGYMAQEYTNVIKSLKIKKTISVLGSSYFKSNSFKIKNNLDFAARSLDQLYKKNKADYLIVCVKEEKLYLLINKIIKYNWNCLFEKPLGYNYQQTINIAKKLKKKNYFVGLNRRSYASTCEAVNILKKINNKSMKRVVEIVDQENLEYQKKIGTNKMVIKNFMYVNSLHLVDYTNIFCRGAISKIDIIKPFVREKSHIMIKKIHFSSGDICIYKCFWNLNARWSVKIMQGKYTILLKPLEKIVSKNINSNKIQKTLKKWDKQFKPGIKYQVINFLNKNSAYILRPSQYVNLATRVKKIFFDEKI